MAWICKKCGKVVPEGATQCPSCGVKLVLPGGGARRPAAMPAAKPESVSTKWFFGHIFLYAIPVIGWIACIATAASAENGTKKNYAKAILLWLLICAAVAVVGYVAWRVVTALMAAAVEQALSGQVQ